MTATTKPLIATLTMLAVATPASADPVADFFRDRQINWIVSYGPGGSYGLYAQLAARHIAQAPAGQADHRRAVHAAARAASPRPTISTISRPRTAATIATVTKDLALEQALRPKEVRYDARQFGWVGTFAEYIAVFAVWTGSGITSIEDARQRETILADQRTRPSGLAARRRCSTSSPARNSSSSPAIAAPPT